MTAAIGQPLGRLDGPAKVTGAAVYSSDVLLPGLAYAVVVGSSIASGRIAAIDTGAARRAAGVLAVLTHENLPPVAATPRLVPSLAGGPAPGQSFFPMQDDAVHYAGQPVAVVVADTLERAQFGAAQVAVSYRETPPVVFVDQARDSAYQPERIFGGFLPGTVRRGDPEAGLADAAVRVERTYRLAPNHHNPIEPSATTAVWDGDLLTLHDGTQGVAATQFTVAELLGVPPARVRTLAPFVGGSFGSKAMVWPHATLAALAAREVGRPVRLVLTREQMFTSCGLREEQEHRIVLGAARDGRLTAIRHHKISPTSRFDDWAEPSLTGAQAIYACPNYEGGYRLVPANTMTPTFMRAPGEASGMFVMETAMDELAHELGLDPMDLRLRNYAETEPSTGNPWSSKGLRECYRRGAELFGWAGRDPQPRSRRDGHWLIGSGMASAIYPIAQPGSPQRARARMYADGSAVLQAATPEFGTGVVTVMTQVAADALGVPVDRVRFEHGDSDLPNTAAAVASSGAGMISAAVHLAGVALRDQLVARAVADERSPLYGAAPGAVLVRDGRMALRDRGEAGESYADLLRRNHQPDAEALGVWEPPPPDTPHGMFVFGAQFAEVAVDAELGVVRVRRMVGSFAPGRVLNPRTARSQLMGGMLWGVGQALLEASRMDGRHGRWANPSFGDYLVPVNADAPDVAVDLVEVPDPVVNPLGVKGVGEIGIVGAAAAIGNAVFHATGRRVRHLPITVEDLLQRRDRVTSTGVGR